MLVTSVTDGVTANDADVAALLQRSGKPVVLCVNKCDRVGEVPAEFYEFYNLGLGDPIAVSSVHGQGTGDLLDAVFDTCRLLRRKMRSVRKSGWRSSAGRTRENPR